MHSDKIPVQIYFTISLLGLWLIASTLTFGFQSDLIIYTNFACGALLIIFGLMSRKNPTSFKIWTITSLGIWLQFSPLIFWAPLAAAYVNDTFVGIWVIALAITLHPIPGLSFQEKPTIPPGWSYNPSSWAQRLPIAFLAFICWMIARYLSAYQLGYIQTVWDPFFTPGTKNVLESVVSRSFPVSDAGLGALAYTIEFFAACQGGPNRWRSAPWLVLVFGTLVIPVGLVSTILIILQPVAVGTWCTLCLATAICMLIAIPFAVGEVAAALQFLRHYSKQKPFFTLLFYGSECLNETPDTKTPSMDQSLWTLFKASLAGITFPWNLCLCALAGILLMAAPTALNYHGVLYDLNPILGAFTTVVSVVSFAEYARKARWINLFLVLILLIVTWTTYGDQNLWHHLLNTLFAVVIALLSIRKGPIRERFSFEASPSLHK